MNTIAAKYRTFYKLVFGSPEAIRYAFVTVRALHLLIFMIFLGAAVAQVNLGPFLPFAILSVVISVLSQMFVVNIIGHRFIGHGNFRPSRLAQISFLAWSVIVGLSSPLSSSLIHRRHHHNSDSDRDPHSPKRNGYRDKLGFFAMVYLNSFNEKHFSLNELMRESRRPFFIFFHRNGAYLSLGVSVILLLALGLKGLFFLQTIPVLICFLGQFNLVYQTHVPMTEDPLQNHPIDSVVANILTLGEGAHLAHHRSPGQIYYRNKHWLMFDVTGFIIKSVWKR